MFSADGAAQLHTELQDLHARLHDPRLLLGIPPVEEDQRVQVAVAGVEDVGDLQVVLLAHLGDLLQHQRQGRAGHGAIADQVARRDACHGPEGAAPARPEQGPLGLVLGDPHLPRAVLHAEPHDGLGLLFQVILEAIHLDDQHRGAVQRQAAGEGLLHGVDHQLVHHLEGRRHHTRGHDGRHRLAALLDAVVDGQHGLHALGQADDADHHLGAHAEGALAAHEDAREVVARRVRRHPAQFHDLTVRQHHGHAHHVVGGDAVLEAVGSAGVLCHVAAQGRGLLAGGIRQILVAQRRQGLAQLQVEHARLDPGPQAALVHFQQPVHADHLQHHAALEGDGAAAEVRAAAAGDRGHAVGVAELQDAGHLLRGVDEDHRVGAALLEVGIVLVQLEVHVGIDDVGLSDDPTKFLDKDLV